MSTKVDSAKGLTEIAGLDIEGLDIDGLDINPLKPNSSNYYTLAYRPNLPFLISDIRTLWRSGLSSRVSECQKLKW